MLDAFIVRNTMRNSQDGNIPEPEPVFLERVEKWIIWEEKLNMNRAAWLGSSCVHVLTQMYPSFLHWSDLLW